MSAMARGLPFRRFFLILAVAASAGCGMIRNKAIGMVAGTMSSGGDVFTRDDDPELVGDALPFALKLYESLLESVPRNVDLLVATCSVATQYGYAYVQTEADVVEAKDYDAAKRLRERAFKLFLRGKGYCFRALEVRWQGVTQRLIEDPATGLPKARAKDVPLLYWSAASWGAAIGLQTDLAIDLPSVRALVERALALDEDWSRGALHEIMISLESQDAAVGGSEERARAHFKRAVELQRGLSPGPYVGLAMGVSVARQDRAEFERLMNEALAIAPEKDPSNRLVTLITQRRARALLDRIDTLFAKEPDASGGHERGSIS
jgi:predicted anti-sigma-YlaC factor YlaD